MQTTIYWQTEFRQDRRSEGHSHFKRNCIHACKAKPYIGQYRSRSWRLCTASFVVFFPPLVKHSHKSYRLLILPRAEVYTPFVSGILNTGRSKTFRNDFFIKSKRHEKDIPLFYSKKAPLAYIQAFARSYSFWKAAENSSFSTFFNSSVTATWIYAT